MEPTNKSVSEDGAVKIQLLKIEVAKHLRKIKELDDLNSKLSDTVRELNASNPEALAKLRETQGNLMDEREELTLELHRTKELVVILKQCLVELLEGVVC